MTAVISTTRGSGKKGQDWSYLTPKRAIAVQTDNVTDPSNLGDEFEIDTTVTRKGDPVDRARQQTLVIFAVPKSGVSIANDAVLCLWSKVDWVDTGCADASSSSSSCPNVGSPNDLDDADRWALIQASTLSNAPAGLTGAKCFSFPWLPAGIYKAAMSTGISGGTKEVIIVEQHTE